MSYIALVPGVRKISGAGDGVSEEDLAPLRQKIFERDAHTCRGCGFTAKKYHEIHSRTGPLEDANSDNIVTLCIFCRQCFDLDFVARAQSGALIWLPEIGQAALNHIARAIYVARITQGPVADAARSALEILLKRKEDAKRKLGTDDPAMLASILGDFLELTEYKARAKKLDGLRIMPLDRRIVREGDLEFNQFPQILAYWRSKDGPFGELPPKTWQEMFEELQQKTA